MKYNNIIKYTSINAGIYILNSILTYFFTYVIVLHILCFITVIVIVDAVNLQHHYNLLELKYEDLKNKNSIEYDLISIKNKIDILLTADNKTNENHIINIDIKDSDFNYKLAKKALGCSKSLSFVKRSPKKEEELSQMIVPNIGEVINYIK